MLLLPNSQVAENKAEICLGKTAEHIFFLQKSQLISTQNKRLQVKEMHVACCIHAAYLATVSITRLFFRPRIDLPENLLEPQETGNCG